MNNKIIYKNSDLQNSTDLLTLEDENVQKVISIAQQIIRENKPMKIKILYNRSIKQLDINSNELFNIIQYLINKKILIDGSKHTRKTILLNDNRRKLYNIILKNKGASFNFLRKEIFSSTQGSGGHLIWHLQMLIKFNYVKKLKIGNYTVFLPINMDLELGKLYFFMNNEINNKIIITIINQDKIRKPDVHKLLEEPRSTINYRINCLIEYDILKVKDTSTKEIHINPKLYEKVLRIIKDNKKLLNDGQKSKN
ncbi:MAG: hypothetical protein JXA99_11410 [Candidatus Lokiarchaeota archaeon]|nr:hypothetical protein [Candidatus Lokiarchaeota archaeon]